MFSKKSELRLINMHLPYCKRANTDDFLAFLGKLGNCVMSCNAQTFVLWGTSNAGVTNTLCGLLEDFCVENDFIISGYTLLPQDTFTYIGDAHNTTSRIEHFVSSFSVHKAMFNMQAAFSASNFLNLMMR